MFFVLQCIFFGGLGFFLVVNVIRIVLRIVQKIKNKKYEAAQGEGSDERET